MPWDPDRNIAKLIAVAFLVGFFGFLLKSYWDEGRPSAASAVFEAETPAPIEVLPEQRAPAQPAKAPRPVTKATAGGAALESATNVLTLAQAVALADKSPLGGPFYLRGDFVITALGKGRAVLRAVSVDDASGDGSANAARVLVEYPEGAALPAKGSRLSLAPDQALEITSIRRDSDGVVTIYTRGSQRAAPAPPDKRQSREQPKSPTHAGDVGLTLL